MPTKFETISAALSRLPGNCIIFFALSGAIRATPIVEKYASEKAKLLVNKALALLWRLSEGRASKEEAERVLQQICELPDVEMDDSTKLEYTSMKAIGVVVDAVSLAKGGETESQAVAVCAGMLNLTGGIDYLVRPYRPPSAKKLSEIEEEIQLRTIQMLGDARNTEDMRLAVESLNGPFIEALAEMLPLAERRLRENRGTK